MCWNSIHATAVPRSLATRPSRGSSPARSSICPRDRLQTIARLPPFERAELDLPAEFPAAGREFRGLSADGCLQGPAVGAGELRSVRSLVAGEPRALRQLLFLRPMPRMEPAAGVAPSCAGRSRWTTNATAAGCHRAERRKRSPPKLFPQRRRHLRMHWQKIAAYRW